MRFWESLRRCPGASQLPHVASLVPTHVLGDRRGSRAAVWAPHPWVVALIHPLCAGRFLSGPSAPAGRRGRRRWRNLFTRTRRVSRGPRSRRTVVRTQWHGRVWGRGHCGRDIRQVPPWWVHGTSATMVGHGAGDTAVGTSHCDGDTAGDMEGCSRGMQGCCGGIMGTQWNAVGRWGDAV